MDMRDIVRLHCASDAYQLHDQGRKLPGTAGGIPTSIANLAFQQPVLLPIPHCFLFRRNNFVQQLPLYAKHPLPEDLKSADA